MTWIDTVNKKRESLFERLDQVHFKTKRITWFYSIAQYSTYAGMYAYFFEALIFIHTNPILNRGFNDGGHVLAYISLLTLAVVARMYMPKTTEGMYYSLLIPAFALSVSEGSFNIFYYVVYYPMWPHVTWDIFILTNPLAMLYIFVIMIGVFITPVWKYLNIKYAWLSVAIIEGYFLIWALAGLPVTLSSIEYLNGGSLTTSLYDSIRVNLTEIGQWFIASVTTMIAIITFKAKLLGDSNFVED